MADLKSKNIILICGNEEYLKEQKKDELLDGLGTSGSLNFNTFSGENMDLDEIGRLSVTVPFFEEYRKILIRDSGFFEKNTAQAGVVSDILNDLPETSVIIFYEKNFSATNSLYKLVKKKGLIFNFNNVDTLKGPEKEALRQKIRSWAKERLRIEKRELDSRTLYDLLELTGYDMQNLSTELEKLICYTLDKSPDYRITQKDIDKICSRTLSDRVFAMLDMKLKRDISGAIQALEELFSLKVPAMKTLSMLERQYYQALSVRDCLDKKISDKEICQMMELKDWQLRRLKNQVRETTYAELLDKLEECVRMDFRIKNGDISDRLAVEILMVS